MYIRTSMRFLEPLGIQISRQWYFNILGNQNLARYGNDMPEVINDFRALSLETVVCCSYASNGLGSQV